MTITSLLKYDNDWHADKRWYLPISLSLSLSLTHTPHNTHTHTCTMQVLNHTVPGCGQTLEVELETKADLLRASEAAKASQRVDLENHISTVQAAADQAQAELNTAKQQLEQVGSASSDEQPASPDEDQAT